MAQSQPDLKADPPEKAKDQDAPPLPPPPSGLYRSSTNYKLRCGLLGCSVLVPFGSNYCCTAHHHMSIHNITRRAAFQFLGGFSTDKEMQETCFTCLQNKSTEVEVGIPTLTSEVFARPPWVQPEVFRTDLGLSHWLFFVRSPIECTRMPIPDYSPKLRWTMEPKYPLTLRAHLPQEKDIAYQTELNLKGSSIGEDVYNEAQRWKLHLFQLRDVNL